MHLGDKFVRSATVSAAVLTILSLPPAALAQGRTGRAAARTTAAGPMPKMPDGKPDMQGIWAATAFGPAYDIEDHPVAQFGIPAGKGVIVDPPDGKIPYKPGAAAKKKDLLEHHMYQDPEAHCTLSGVPRQMYAPFGFQIFQPAGYVVLFFEAFHAYRIIPMDGRPHAPASIKMFEGDSRGHWEGNTLVVDVTNQNGDTWFDMAGNFHSDAIHVVERLTPIDANTIQYEATIEDPNVYTRPWKIAFTIARNKQRSYELMEYACVEGEQDLKHYIKDDGGKAASK